MPAGECPVCRGPPVRNRRGLNWNRSGVRREPQAGHRFGDAGNRSHRIGSTGEIQNRRQRGDARDPRNHPRRRPRPGDRGLGDVCLSVLEAHAHPRRQIPVGDGGHALPELLVDPAHEAALRVERFAAGSTGSQVRCHFGRQVGVGESGRGVPEPSANACATHRSLSARRRRAWWSRDLTVPSASPVSAATSRKPCPSRAASTTTIRSRSGSASTSCHRRCRNWLEEAVSSALGGCGEIGHGQFPPSPASPRSPGDRAPAATDPDEPGTETARVPQRPEVGMRAHERLLGDVLGVLALAQHGIGDAEGQGRISRRADLRTLSPSRRSRRFYRLDRPHGRSARSRSPHKRSRPACIGTLRPTRRHGALYGSNVASADQGSALRAPAFGSRGCALDRMPDPWFRSFLSGPYSRASHGRPSDRGALTARTAPAAQASSLPSVGRLPARRA